MHAFSKTGQEHGTGPNRSPEICATGPGQAVQPVIGQLRIGTEDRGSYERICRGKRKGL